ncbi:MAG: ComF family protein [Anaerolineae bacterium]|nr:ComF family protein [Anaerolineae bacterium]
MQHRDPPNEQAKRPIVARIIALGIDLLYPPRCAGCGRVGTRWCERCLDELARQPLDVRRVRPSQTFIVAATAIHEGKLQQAVHALKYSGAREELVAPLGDRLLAALDVLNWTFDTIIPVPLHTARERARGYNQSQQLGAYMAQVLGISCDPSALLRWRDTPPQVGLNREQRRANVRGAFRATTALTGSVLVVDDVFTTGATLQDCARAAYEAGASRVYGLTVTAARS